MTSLNKPCGRSILVSGVPTDIDNDELIDILKVQVECVNKTVDIANDERIITLRSEKGGKTYYFTID